MLGAANLFDYEIEFSGALFVFFLVVTLVYFPLLWLLEKAKVLNRTPSWRRIETLIFSIIVGLSCFIGAMEAYPSYMLFSILFAEMSVLALVFFYLNYKYKRAAGETFAVFKKWILPKHRNLTIAVAIAMLILVLTIYEYEPVVNLLAFFYIIALFVVGVRWLIKQMKLIIELKNEKAKTELVHLQSQVNPHFFFNVLNNLYGLVKQDSQKAQDLILRLSDMMRYSIYEGQKDIVKLEDEVAYLKNFIDLHHMRYRKKLDV